MWVRVRNSNRPGRGVVETVAGNTRHRLCNPYFLFLWLTVPVYSLYLKRRIQLWPGLGHPTYHCKQISCCCSATVNEI